MGSWRPRALPSPGPSPGSSPCSGRRAAVIELSLMALTSLPPSENTARIRLLPTQDHDASRAPFHQTVPGLRRDIASGKPGIPDDRELLLDQADHPVVVTA